MKKIFFSIAVSGLIVLNFMTASPYVTSDSIDLKFFTTAMAGLDSEGNPVKDTPKSTCCQCGSIIKVCCPNDYIGPCQKTCGS